VPPLELELELEALDEALLLDEDPVLLVLVLPPKLDELPVAPLLVELPLDDPDALEEEAELPELAELPLDPEEPLELCGGFS
jgi:hypothetical protein